GPRRDGEIDGPEHMYYVLLDAGRSELIGGEFHEMLRCIRCGACMNHCPVYQKVGGHTYGWVYPGPMGAVLTPNYVGIENAIDLPQAATFCNQCSVVCPVKIPLPDLMRKLREAQWKRGLRPWYEKLGVAGWAFAAKRPAIYAFATKVAVRVLGWMSGDDRRIRTLPIGKGWTLSRDFPAPSGKTFRALYRARQPQPQRSTRE
ncbi:MAG TPA: 4Fe-4S dicluster domain-containing protein, partial [Burkholderiaceae bacterium]|nr:4Fe-4S dicluster domain-containing protein [Burkholderiaceae bacterium]